MTDGFDRPLDDRTMDQLFRSARTQNAWLDRPVDDALLHQLYDLVKMGPTSANSLPARIVFVRTPEGKERLKPYLMDQNVDKTMSAPVCAILAYDVEFWKRMDETFPHNPDAPSWFNWSEDWARTNAFRNGTLQAGYFILAARTLGLDTGAMSGFDMDGVNKEFFAGTTIEANFLCNLGYGDPAGVMDRLPRLAFEDVCEMI